MAETARSMGLEYFGICDHSQSLSVAGGLSPDEVAEQQREIDRLNAQYEADGADFRIFSGIESDILADGSLDYAPDVLASFDLVVASVHSGFNMSEAEATERVVTAVQNPYTTILGHPTGRLLLRREGYPLDHERVIAACADHDVAIELNANPYRLDLDWRWVRRATEAGVRIAINPDAHATDELANMRWGVAAARKGWLTPAQCLNALSRDAFADWLARRSPQPAA
jgi:DNA polymerase (family 10)